MEVASICQKLDEAAIKYFEILEELTERKKRLQDGLREGYFSLSKARYSMGSRSVGSLQYNTTNMKALASVEVSDECGSCIFFHQRREPTKKTAKQKQAGSDKDRNTEVQSTESQVRRRKAEENGPEESELQDRIQELSIEEVTFQDPLKWFGILVPAALRQGQNAFIEAVEQCVEIATLQNKLMATQLEYQELRKTKMELNDQTENVDDTKEGETNVGRTG